MNNNLQTPQKFHPQAYKGENEAEKISRECYHSASFCCSKNVVKPQPATDKEADCA